MENITLSIIQHLAPKAHEDFEEFYKEILSQNATFKNTNFDSLPFEMQLGYFLKYFNMNAIELDVCNTDFKELPERILEAFKEFEKVISHSS